jgi:hypothetical protein
MKIDSIQAEQSRPLAEDRASYVSCHVSLYFDDPAMDVLTALHHIHTMASLYAKHVEGTPDAPDFGQPVFGSVVEVYGTGEPDGDAAASDAPVGGDDDGKTVEPEPKTRSRRSRTRSTGTVVADADASSGEDTPAPEEKAKGRARRSRSKPAESKDDKGSEGSDSDTADSGDGRATRRSRGGAKAGVTSHQMSAEDLMKAAGEAADSIGPSAVMDIITGFGHKSASDIPDDKRAEVAAKLIEACE